VSQVLNYYDILQIAETAEDYIVRAAYRALTQKTHPDKNNSSKESTLQMQLINEAYNVLSDNAARKNYDATMNADRELAPKQTENIVRETAREIGRQLVKEIIEELKKRK
jgi:DnaJ-class molecular chaperone